MVGVLVLTGSPRIHAAADRYAAGRVEIIMSLPTASGVIDYSMATLLCCNLTVSCQKKRFAK
jgi:hypothetical protein